MVGNAAPPHRMTELRLKFEPFTVRVKLRCTTAVVGETLLSVGDGLLTVKTCPRCCRRQGRG